MFERFTHEAREVVRQAEEEARDLGSRTIEAEHLLLALAAGPSPVAGLMAEHGLGHDAVVVALQREEERSLSAVGVSADAYGAPAALRVAGRVRFGTSAKRALERTLQEALALGSKRLDAAHILLGVLAADHGTVPRALRMAPAGAQELRRAVLAAVR